MEPSHFSEYEKSFIEISTEIVTEGKNPTKIQEYRVQASINSMPQMSI